MEARSAEPAEGDSQLRGVNDDDALVPAVSIFFARRGSVSLERFLSLE